MPNRLSSSSCHCPISDLGTINKTRSAPSARLCASTSPASIVFPQSHLISEDATALAEASERENHRVDLVRIGVDPRLPLRRGVAFPVIRAADADEILGQEASIERVEGRATSFRWHARTPWTHTAPDYGR